MPKVVDHDARRREITGAVWGVVQRDGIERATVRAVAVEASWSPGAVRHYFPDHAALVQYAVEQVLVRASERIAHRLAARPSRAAAQRLLEELLPFDAERRVEMVVWLAAMDRARTGRDLDAAHAEMWQGCRHVARVAFAWITQAQAPRSVGDLLDARGERQAAVLHTLLDGLAVQAFVHPDAMPIGHARLILADHLRTLGN